MPLIALPETTADMVRPVTAVAELTVSASITAVLVPPAFVAVRLTLEEPAAVGVPLIAPVAVLMLRPAGRPVAA